MKLFTKAIEKKLQTNYPKGSSFDQNVEVKLFNPVGAHTWYIMNQDPKDLDYLWCIVKNGDFIETGSVLKSELEGIKLPFGLKIERDLYFDPKPAKEIWDRLQKGEHI